MGDDPPLVHELAPDLLRKAEVGGTVAVKVTDLAAADLEGELPAASGAGLHARPRGDLVGDLLAGCPLFAHVAQATSSSKLEVKGDGAVAELLTIGEVSRRSGVAASALRFYEDRGLIESERSGSGHRHYRRPVLRRVAVNGAVSRHNAGYLRTKRDRTGHLIDLDLEGTG